MIKTLGYGLFVLCCLAWLLILVIPWMEFSKGETAGIFVYFEASSFQKKSRVTEGKVVYVPGFSYRIQYVTDDGTEKIKQGSGKNHGFREGATTSVWYNIDNPDRARLTDGKLWKEYATYTLGLPEKVYLGAAVTSHKTTESAAAKFREMGNIIR